MTSQVRCSVDTTAILGDLLVVAGARLFLNGRYADGVGAVDAGVGGRDLLEVEAACRAGPSGQAHLSAALLVGEHLYQGRHQPVDVVRGAQAPGSALRD